MKRLLMIIASVIGILILFFGSVMWIRSYDSPDYLLGRLRSHPTERDIIIRKLGLISEDTLPHLKARFRDRSLPSRFRADVLELLFHRFARRRSKEVEILIRGALSDPHSAVRAKAIEGYILYLEPKDQVAVTAALNDEDPEVQKRAYELVVGSGRSDGGGSRKGLWQYLSDTRLHQMVESAQDLAATTDDPVLRDLALSVIGRRIEALCELATDYLTRSDVIGAEEMLSKAEALDPDHRLLNVRRVRHLIRIGEPKEALRTGKQSGAVLVIPPLSAAPTIDGDPEDPIWEEALTNDTFFLSTSRFIAKHSMGRTVASIGYRGDTIFIRVMGYERDLDKLVVRQSERDGPIWTDDSVELFFDPTLQESAAYQFVINPLGAMFDMYQWRKERNFPAQRSAQVFDDRGYWAVEFAINGEHLDNNPISSESIWGINIMRARIGVASEQCAWWPCFGRSSRYGLFPVAIFKDAPSPPEQLLPGTP